MRRTIYTLIVLALVVGFVAPWQQQAVLAQDSESSDTEILGEKLFFDPNLSVNKKQSCATCHGPEAGFTGPDSQANLATGVYPGAIETRYGNRKPPAANYTGDSPELYFDEGLGKWVGGMFWDGRASGAILHDPLAEQAQGPFLNPLEQAMPDARLVAVRVAQSDYAELFEQVWGEGSLDFSKDVEGVYERIGRSIAAYERSAEANPFTSKFDLFWDNAVAAGKDVTKIKCGTGGGGMGGGGTGGGAMMGCPGGGMDPNRWSTFRNLGLSDDELKGLAAFNDPGRANCASCHSLEPGSDSYPLFTNFAYDNLGIPKNPENPFYNMPPAWNPDGEAWVDTGLGGFLMSTSQPEDVYEAQLGKFKIPSLRNVDLRPTPDFVKAYGHNGYFKSLEDIIMFYAWRGLTMNGGLGLGGSGMDCGMMGGGMGGDMAMMCNPDLFPQPEVNQNLTPMNHFNVMDQANILAFLKTLSDGYFER